MCENEVEARDIPFLLNGHTKERERRDCVAIKKRKSYPGFFSFSSLDGLMNERKR